MSLRLIKHADHLELLEGDLPLEKEIRLFTEDEVLQFEGWKQWISLTEEQRDDMMLQTQSAEYSEWMEEEDWVECKVEEGQGTYGKDKFIP